MSTAHTPKLVSVIVPVYNRGHMVARTLDSILRQSYPHTEIVAVNDGSSDASLAVLSEYARRHPGKMVVVDQSNQGQARARNNGIAASSGEYIAFLDSDDTWNPDKLSLQMPLFRGRVGLVYSGINEVDLEDRITGTVLPEPGMRGDIYRQLLVKNRMTGGSVVVTRRAIDQVGCFDESFRAAENWDLWIRISREYEVDYVDKPLVNYLKHQGNMSQDNRRMMEGSRAILTKHLPTPLRGGRLGDSYFEAYANFYYGLGAQHFGRYEYKQARKMFFQCWKYKLFYRDSLLRVCRTLVGIKTNRCLARLKSKRM